MIMTIMVIGLVATMATTVATLTINNLQSSKRAQEAGVAVNAADAGVSQAVSYLRANGIRGLCARPTTFDRATEAAGQFDRAFDLATRQCVNGPNAGVRLPGQPYSVLIVTDRPYAAGVVGRYVVYSRGVGQVAAARLVSAAIEVDGVDVPQGMFGRSVSAGGNVTIKNQSVFTTGCVHKRSNMKLEGIDAYGLPAAVRSARAITNDQVNKSDCENADKAIHKTSPCDPAYPFDQDVLGGPFGASSPCVSARTNTEYSSITSKTWAKYYPAAEGSRITSASELLQRYSIQDPALTRPQIEQLRRTAMRQGNLFKNPIPSSGYTPPQAHAVLFFDLTLSSSKEVDLRYIHGFTPPADTTCPDKSLVIVIEGGTAKFPQGTLAASLFLTTDGGAYYPTGGTVVGSVFTDLLNLGGNAEVLPKDQSCFRDSPSPSLMEISVVSYRELDS